MLETKNDQIANLFFENKPKKYPIGEISPLKITLPLIDNCTCNLVNNSIYTRTNYPKRS